MWGYRMEGDELLFAWSEENKTVNIGAECEEQRAMYYAHRLGICKTDCISKCIFRSCDSGFRKML